MKYSHEKKHDVIILHVEDDSPWGKENGFREVLSSLTEQDFCYIVVELSGLSYADIYTLTCLVWGRKRALRAGGDLVLVALSPPIRTILKLTTLDRFFAWFDSEEEAIQSLQAHRLATVRTRRAVGVPFSLPALQS